MFLTRIAGVAIAFALVASACATPQAGYVDDVAGIVDRMSQDVFAALPRGVVPTRAGVTGVVAARRTAAEALAAIVPPAEFRAEHLVLVIALETFVTSSERFLESTEGLDHDAFTAALSASTDLDPLAATLGAACTAWERRAADLGTPARLACDVPSS